MLVCFADIARAVIHVMVSATTVALDVVWDWACTSTMFGASAGFEIDVSSGIATGGRGKLGCRSGPFMFGQRLSVKVL
jgi:hypothetical protein